MYDPEKLRLTTVNAEDRAEGEGEPVWLTLSRGIHSLEKRDI